MPYYSAVNSNAVVNVHRRSNSLTMPMNRKYSKSQSPISSPLAHQKGSFACTPPTSKKQTTVSIIAPLPSVILIIPKLSYLNRDFFQSSAPLANKTGTLTKSKSTDNAKITALKGVDSSLVKRIMEEVLEESPSVKWEDIAGQEVKMALKVILKNP